MENPQLAMHKISKTPWKETEQEKPKDMTLVSALENTFTVDEVLIEAKCEYSSRKSGDSSAELKVKHKPISTSRGKNTFSGNGKFGLGMWNEAGQRLIEFCQENALVIANTLFQQHKRRLHMDITRWSTPKSD